MKAMRKSYVHLAVAATLVGLAATTGVVNAAEVSRSGTGQALVFPYYTVNNGWTTTFNVMNTSPNTVAVKVRFHEYKNSRDVLDFNIVMSPYDAWTGWIYDDPEKGPTLRTEDKSCTSPLVVDGASTSEIAYTGPFTDTGGAGKNRMREGYVEMLVMGIATPASPGASAPPAGFSVSGAFTPPVSSLYVPYHAEHVEGVPRDCSIVDQAFIATVGTWVEGTDPVTYNNAAAPGLHPASLGGSGDPLARIDFVAPLPTDNPLKGNVSWLHAGTGTGAGSEALAVADWSDQNYVTAQQPPWFLEPTFASGNGLWTVTGVLDFELAVAAAATFNEWANNPVNGAATDMIVNFPTKGYHVDQFNDQIQAAVSKYRNALNPVVTCVVPADRTTCSLALTSPIAVAPFEHLFGVQGTGDSQITVEYTLFDREEGSVVTETDGTVISPAPPPTVRVDSLRFEANVLQFSSEQGVVDATLPAVLDASGLLNGAPNGWVSVGFTGLNAQGIGLPVAAFVIKERDRGEPGTNYGQAMQNGYDLIAPVVVNGQ